LYYNVYYIGVFHIRFIINYFSGVRECTIICVTFGTKLYIFSNLKNTLKNAHKYSSVVQYIYNIVMVGSIIIVVAW